MILQKAEVASKEKNRASAVALNAEIRRTKARLLEEVPKLQKLAIKKVSLYCHNDIVKLISCNFDSHEISFWKNLSWVPHFIQNCKLVKD